MSRALTMLLLAVVLASCACQAVDSKSEPSVSWMPRQLSSGSVCLFSVDFGSATSSVTGTWMGHELFFAKARGRNSWFAAAGVDVEAKAGTYPLKLEAVLANGKTVAIDRDIHVLPAPYKTEKLTVPPRFVEPSPEEQVIIKADREIKEKAFAHPEPAPEWSGDFEAPLNSTVSESFGTRRTLNGKLATIHRGVDYHAKMGTPVLASNSGIVILARPLYYEGNCVVIDHGQGLMTIYMHLSKFKVAEGDKVKKGEEVGLSGATGRVTGPHLHMAARWDGAYVDPQKLLKLQLPILTPPAKENPPSGGL